MATTHSIEKWLPVVGYEGAYSVSSLGRVRRDSSGKGATPGKILAYEKHHAGYLRVRLSVRQECQKHRVHRLVAAAFLGLCPPGRVINHRDGDKANNNITNLEYVTPLENMRHAHEVLRVKTGSKILNKKALKKVRSLYAAGYSTCRIAGVMKVRQETIKSIVSGRHYRDVL